MKYRDQHSGMIRSYVFEGGSGVTGGKFERYREESCCSLIPWRKGTIVLLTGPVLVFAFIGCVWWEGSHMYRKNDLSCSVSLQSTNESTERTGHYSSVNF